MTKQTLRASIKSTITRVLNEHGGMYNAGVIDPLADAVMAYFDTRKAERPKRDEFSFMPAAQALAEVCGMDFAANRGQLFAEAKRLAKHPADIRRYFAPGAWWYTEDWRGQRGQPPTPAQVRQTWGKWSTATQADEPAKAEDAAPMPTPIVLGGDGGFDL